MLSTAWLTAHQAVLAVNLLSPTSLIETFGTIGVILIIFAETGILIGLFLPGDSLLFTAGFLCSTTVAGVHLRLAAILPGAAVAAVAGAQVGYLIGRHAGPALFRRPDSRLFQQRYVDRASDYFERYGPAKAVVLARFVPIVRTLLNPLAGILRMDGRRFALWNAVGGIFWTVLVTMLGYALGSSLPPGRSIDTYILPAVAVIIVLSLFPVAMEFRRARRERGEHR